MIHKILASAILFCFSVSLASQNNQFSNYQPLKSYGKIPSIIIESPFDRYNKEIADLSIESKEKTNKQKKDFYLKSSYSLTEILTSGKVLFGDPVSLYINEIAKELLKTDPELYKKLQFYTLKSSVPNASSTSQGVIFFNIGLFAKLKNEAEVAFVLAHEIAHYLAEDPVNSYLDKIKIIKGKDRFNSKSIDDKISQLGIYSRTIEYKADSLATNIFLKSKYSPTNISSALKSLYYSNLPTFEIPFDKSFFNTKDFKIPACFFADSVASILPIKDKNDENQTHPDITKRIKQVENLTKESDNTLKKDFVISESKFKEMKEIALFELVRLHVAYREYGDAIYLSFCLLQKYPQNEYLSINVAKALYGLCKYKNADEFHRAAASYTKVQGQSQQVHFLLRQLTREQLNMLALKYVVELEKKYANNCLQNIENDLIDELVINCKLTIDSLKNYDKKEIHEDQNLSITEQRKQYSDFYRCALKTEIQKETTIEKFKLAEKKLLAVTKFKQLSFKEKEKVKEDKKNDILKNGLDYRPDTVFILEPFYDNESSNSNKALTDSEMNTKKYQESLKSIKNGKGMKTPLLTYASLNNSETDKFNQISALIELANEKFSNQIDNFYPVGSYLIDYAKDTNKSILCLNGIFDEMNTKLYFNFFIDLNTGKFIYKHDKQISMLSSLGSYLESDLSLFKNK